MNFELSSMPNKPVSPVVLTLDVEVETGCGFPDPAKAKLYQLGVISLHISGMDGVVTFGTHELSRYVKEDIKNGGGRYILCKDESDMVTRAIRFIESSKPTHLLGDDSGPALDALHARARALGLKIDIPDFDRMFREYDMPFSKLYGVPTVHRTDLSAYKICAASRKELKLAARKAVSNFGLNAVH